MKIVKNASGEKVVKMSRKEWEDLGKQAGWLKEASEEEMLREAQPAVKPAPTKPATKPAGDPSKKPAGKPGPRRPGNPAPLVNPNPQGKTPSKNKEETEEVSSPEEASPENLPTIASELKKFRKRGEINV